jgi:hypothetical protein
MTATSIEEKNKAFWKLSPKKQCIAVAKDVLLQLAAHKYIARNMSYVTVDWVKPGADLQKVLLDAEGRTCEVCAIGAAVCSIARMGAGVEYADCDYCGKVANVFGTNQAWLIEEHFEGWDTHAYKYKYPNPTDRLEAIFTNILENDGVFKP